MTSKRYYNSLLTLLGIFVLTIGGFAQGNHGDKHGGGENHDKRGGGQQEQRGNGDNGNRGGDHGNRGNGHQQGGGEQQHVYQQQQQQQEQQHQNDWARQQQEAYARQQQIQQNDHARQQQQHDWDRQQQQHDWVRQQQQADHRQQQQYDNRGDRGRHNGGNNDGPRGNAYGLRGIWPGEFRGWRDLDKQALKAERRNRRSDAYYYSDPLNNFYPNYQQPNYGYNNYNGYNEPPTRENIMRSIISSFFAPETDYGNAYYAAPVYQGYTPAYNGFQQNQYYGGNNTPNYSPAYGYDQGYDPYGNSPVDGSQLFGGGGLKSSLLNIGLEILQGFLGQGYQQGLNQGQYVRDNYGTRSSNYYDPYAAAEPAYYSPIASSFSDQRQLLQEGYRLGYQDAMRNQDPYSTGLGGGGNVDMISEFLANTLLSRI